MATTFGLGNVESAQQALTTDLNTLGSGSTALSAEINNATGLYPFIDIELYLASFTPAAGAPYSQVWILYALDGTNYEDGSAGSPGTIPAKPPDMVIEHRASTAGTQRTTKGNIPLLPYKFKIMYQSVAGANLASSGNILSYARHGNQGS